MFKLISENLTHLGGPMGSEYTTTNYTKYFSTIQKAQKYAETEYGNKIDWTQKKSPTRNLIPIDILCSGDLRYVMYHIRKVKLEE